MPIALSQALLVAARTGGNVDALAAELRAAELRAVDPGALPDDPTRLAFWINLYNAAVRVGVRVGGMRGDLRTHRGFFHRVGWEVGGRFVALHAIEHGIVRANRPAPWTFWRPLRAGDPRRAWAVGRLDPRVHFALNCGAVSCPPIRAYAPDVLDEQLALATRSYLDAEVIVEGEALRLPYLCRLYRRDFPDVRTFAADHVDPARAAWIRAHPDAPLRWGPYRWEIVAED